jgi:hypothetical protein
MFRIVKLVTELNFSVILVSVINLLVLEKKQTECKKLIEEINRYNCSKLKSERGLIRVEQIPEA